MSTRVLPVGGGLTIFNFRMSDLRRRLQLPASTAQPDSATPSPDHSHPAVQVDHSISIHQTRSVRRNLFGPINHDENLKFVQEELSKIADADSRRWNFDFDKDEPLEGRYTWEVPKLTNVPIAYNMQNLTSRLTQVAQPTPSSSKPDKTLLGAPQVPSEVGSSHTVTCQRISPPVSTNESSLQLTLHRVTTASTTVKTVASATEESFRESSTVYTCNSEPSIQLAGQKNTPKEHNSKQTHITDFLKIRKRARVLSDSEGKDDGDVPLLPLLKRTRQSP